MKWKGGLIHYRFYVADTVLGVFNVERICLGCSHRMCMSFVRAQTARGLRSTSFLTSNLSAVRSCARNNFTESCSTGNVKNEDNFRPASEFFFL